MLFRRRRRRQGNRGSLEIIVGRGVSVCAPPPNRAPVWPITVYDARVKRNRSHDKVHVANPPTGMCTSSIASQIQFWSSRHLEHVGGACFLEVDLNVEPQMEKCRETFCLVESEYPTFKKAKNREITCHSKRQHHDLSHQPSALRAISGPERESGDAKARIVHD